MLRCSRSCRAWKRTAPAPSAAPTPEENWPWSSTAPPDQIEELLRTSRQPISLDSTIGEDGETSIGDLIEDVDAPEPRSWWTAS